MVVVQNKRTRGKSRKKNNKGENEMILITKRKNGSDCTVARQDLRANSRPKLGTPIFSGERPAQLHHLGPKPPALAEISASLAESVPASDFAQLS